MASTKSPFVTPSLGATDRRDNWWLAPLATAIGFALFGIYSTWAAAQNGFYAAPDALHGPYLSPFYSPLFRPSWLPGWFSPAFLILGSPLGFRATCYYYRKAYYRAFFFNPPACGVGSGKPQGNYAGERAFPFILQNLHRFFLYLALIVLVVLWYDVGLAFFWPVVNAANEVVGHQFGVGLGTLIMLANVVLLTAYTCGCHSLRHLVGGSIDCFSCQTFGKERHEVWQGVTWLNERHQLFAWLSLFSVGFTDIYIRLVSMGIWHDLLFFKL